ncbi:MAG: MFS transporter [Planctomycetota bacterium]
MSTETTSAVTPTRHEDPTVSAFARLTGFYVASFAVLGAYMQFFPVWLHDVGGLGKREVTLVQSGQVWARTLAGPLWAQRVDREGGAHRILILLSGLSIVAFLAFRLGHGMAWLTVCCVAFGLCYPPMHPILDAFAMQTAHERGFSYPRVRAFGSASFLVVIVAVGAMLEHVASHWIHPLLTVLLVLTAFAAWRLPRTVRPAAEPGRRAPLGALLRQPRFLLFLGAAGLVQGSHGTFYALSTLHWRAHGIGEGLAGLVWAEGVVAEIVLFFAARAFFERLRPTTLILLGAAGAAVRWCALGVTTELGPLLAVNWLHALSFGCTYLGSLRYVRVRVDAAHQATAQGLVGAATSGVGMVVGMLIGGAVYETAGGGAFLWMAGMAACGGAGAFVLRRRRGAPGA